MPTPGDAVFIESGRPAGHEAGFRRPAVIVTARRVLDAGPDVVHVVPLTTRLRGFGTEVPIDDAVTGLAGPPVAQCEHGRAVSADRIDSVAGNVGPVALSRIREVIALLLDLPSRLRAAVPPTGERRTPGQGSRKKSGMRSVSGAAA